PVADLADAVGHGAEADRAEHAARVGLDDCEGMLSEPADVRLCVLERVRLGHLIEPARDLRIAVDALHDRLHVAGLPGPERQRRASPGTRSRAAMPGSPKAGRWLSTRAPTRAVRRRTSSSCASPVPQTASGGTGTRNSPRTATSICATR